MRNPSRSKARSIAVRAGGHWLVVLVAFAVTLSSQTPATAQVRDLLDDLLGRNRGGRIDSVDTVSETGSTVVLRVSYRDVADPRGVALTARVYDLRLRPLNGFTVEPAAIGSAAGDAELRLIYLGPGTVTTASLELRLERDGDVLARDVHPLVRVFTAVAGGEQQDSPLAESEGDVAAGSEVAVADREPQEINIDPQPLPGTPAPGAAAGGGQGSGGGATPGGTTGGGGVLRPGSVLNRPGVLMRVLATPVLGYLWANDQGSSRYTPSAGYSYNSTGGEMVAARAGAGRYGIQFNGLGANSSTAGALAVTAYGSDSGRCQIQSWDTYPAGFQGSVQCVDAGGRPTDSQFTALALLSLGTSRVGYVLADQPTTPSYAPNQRRVSSPGGGAVTVSRSGTGVYAVNIPGLFSNSPDRGNVQVTSFGTAGEHCKATSWTAGAGGTLTATVACYSATGQAADARFALLAVAGTAESANVANYTYANQPSAPSYAPPPELTLSSGATRIARSGPGAYAVRFEGFGGSRGGTVQVTAVGSGNAWCKVQNWGAGADAFNANIRCFAAGGQPADSVFSLLIVR